MKKLAVLDLTVALAVWVGVTGANLAIVAACAAVPTSPSAYVLARRPPMSHAFLFMEDLPVR